MPAIGLQGRARVQQNGGRTLRHNLQVIPDRGAQSLVRTWDGGQPLAASGYGGAGRLAVELHRLPGSRVLMVGGRVVWRGCTATCTGRAGAAGATARGERGRVRYWYVLEAQGDVSGLLDAARRMVASHRYDEWGCRSP